jgi:hypothetical protein
VPTRRLPAHGFELQFGANTSIHEKEMARAGTASCFSATISARELDARNHQGRRSVSFPLNRCS